MSASLAIQFKVQPDDVGLLADDLCRPAAVEGEGNATVLKGAARIAPHHCEGAEAFPASGNVYSSRSAQLMPVWQLHRSRACDVAVHAPLPFQNPACCHRQPPGSTRTQTRGGGNLARVLFTRAGHFSFTQHPQHLEADFTNPTESAADLPAADRAGAATLRLAPAKSRPSPNIQINQVRHAVLLSELKVAAHRSVLAKLSSARSEQ